MARRVIGAKRGACALRWGLFGALLLSVLGASCGHAGTGSQGALTPPPPATAPPARALSPAEQKAAIAEALRTRGVLDRAARSYEAAYRIEPRPEWLLARAQLLAESWAYGDAVQAYSALLQRSDLPAALRGQAAAGLEHARTQAAVPVRELTSADRDPVDEPFARHLREGRTAEARAVLEQALRGPLAPPLDWFDDLAVLLWHDGQHVQAQQTWARARSRMPAEVWAQPEVTMAAPITYQARVLALGDSYLGVETVDETVAQYDFLRRRFVGNYTDARPTDFVLGAGHAWAQCYGAAVQVEGVTSVPSMAGLVTADDAPTESERVTAIALAPTNARLAWGASDGGVSIIAIAEPAHQERRPLPKAAPERKLGSVFALAFDAAGERVAVGHAGGTVRVLSARGKKLAELHDAKAAAYAVAFTPDGQRVISGHEDGVRSWELSSRALVAHIPSPEPVFHVRATGPSTVEFTNHSSVYRTELMPAGAPKSPLSNAEEIFTVIATSVSPNGRLRATTHFKDDGVDLWDAKTDARRGQVRVDTQAGSDVDRSRDGRWFAAAGERVVSVFDLQTGAHQRFELADVSGVALSPDGSLVAAAGYGKELLIWDTRTQRVARRVPTERTGEPTRVEFFPDGRSLALHSRAGLRVVNVATGEVEPKRADVSGVDIGRDAVAIATGGDESAPKLSVRRGPTLNAPVRLEVDGSAPLHLSDETGWLAARQGSEIVVWDERGSERYRTEVDHPVAVALSRTGLLAISEFSSKELTVIDIAANQVVLSVIPHRGLLRTRDLLWAADGRVLITAGHDGIAFWDVKAKRDERLATLRLTNDGWYLLSQTGTGQGSLHTAGFSQAVVTDVTLLGNWSGALIWEGLRDDALLGRLLRCGAASGC